jgi:hypothetical protein
MLDFVPPQRPSVPAREELGALDVKSFLSFFGEQLFHGQFFSRETLFHAVAKKGVDGVSIGVPSIGPKIVAH